MSGALAAFLILAGTILYLAVYPLLLRLRRRRPIEKKITPRSVDVVLAVRNGEQWLEKKLENLAALDYPKERLRVIVVSDGSTDGTGEIARAWQDRGVVLIARPGEGKSAALNAGIAAAEAEILFFTDVRQRLASGSLRQLVACFHDPAVGVVSGELVIADGESAEESSVGLYWKYEKWIRKRLSEIDSFFGATGCIYAMRRELAPKIPKGVLNDDMFLPLAAFFRGFRLILEPAAKAFDVPTSLEVEFRRKVRTQAGVYQLLYYYPQLLGPGNRQWLDFVSYKFARLLLPWLLAAIFAISFFLPGLWRAVLVPQIAFYGLAMLDPLLPERWALKRLTAPLRAFLTLMLAAACAIAVVVIPADRLWQPTPARKGSPV